MMDEIKIYHVDDPNDAPERRLNALPTINPFIQASLPSLPSLPTLPQYVIPPVANSLYTAMQYYWYSAYHQGIASASKHQHQHQHQQPQQQQPQQQQQRNHHHHLNRHLHHNHLHQQPFETRPASISTASSTSSSSSASSSSTSSSSLASSSSSSAAAAAAAATSALSNSSTPTHLQHQQHHSNHNNHHYYLQQQQQLSHPRSIKHELDHHDESSHHQPDHPQRSSLHHQHQVHTQEQQQQSPESHQQQPQNRPQHIKKPLNAYMIYMRERRPAIVKQGIIKESAAMNSMLGEQWRKLTKEEQAPYYKLAEQEKILHAQKYPGWSARDNYANQKKKKKLKLKSISLNGLDQSDKKCRARFGLNNMNSWCKPCKRKKKCIYRTVS